MSTVSHAIHSSFIRKLLWVMTDSQRILSLKKAYGAATRVSLPLDYAQYQNELVNELLLAPHFRGFPPSREFRRIFWKGVVEYLEAEGEVRTQPI